MSDQAASTPRLLGRETISDSFFHLERVTLEQRGAGGRAETLQREVYHNGPGAAVLPFNPQRGTVLLVRQFRVGASLNGDPPLLVELCAGMVDGDDSPEAAVRKEAEQELGYKLHELARVFSLYMSPGATSEVLHLFEARYDEADHQGRGGGLADEGERIRVLELPLDDAWAMVGDGRIRDAKTVLMLQRLRAR